MFRWAAGGAGAGKTHRQLFSEWYEGLWGEPLADLMAEGARPVASEALYGQMMRDILSGGQTSNPVDQVRFCSGLLSDRRGGARRLHVRMTHAPLP